MKLGSTQTYVPCERQYLTADNFRLASFNLKTGKVTYLSDEEKQKLAKVSTIAAQIILGILIVLSAGIVALALLSKKVKRVISLNKTHITPINLIFIKKTSNKTSSSQSEHLSKMLQNIKDGYGELNNYAFIENDIKQSIKRQKKQVQTQSVISLIQSNKTELNQVQQKLPLIREELINNINNLIKNCR